jgi:hypothetical protein
LKRGGLRLTGKYVNNGPMFYSPGAQTNRWTPAAGGAGYVDTDLFLEDGLPGFRNHHALQGVGRPSFAPYDRLTENLLPYGDATPNREALLLGLSGEFGKEGWVKPQVQAALAAREFEPNYVRTGSGDTVLPVDSQTSTATARSLGRLEAAVVLDLSKAWSKAPNTCAFSADLKRETSDPGVGDPLAVQTLLLGADAGPFQGVPLLGGMVLSAAFEKVEASGSEYVLSGVGVPASLAGHAVRNDTGALGTWQYRKLDLSRTTWALGFRHSVSPTFQIHGDFMSRSWTWSDVPGFDRREQVWKVNHELTF